MCIDKIMKQFEALSRKISIETSQICEAKEKIEKLEKLGLEWAELESLLGYSVSRDALIEWYLAKDAINPSAPKRTKRFSHRRWQNQMSSMAQVLISSDSHDEGETY